MGARLVIAVGLQTDAFGKGIIAEGPQFLDDENGNGEAKQSFAEALKTSPQRMLMRQLFGSSPKAPGVGTVMLSALNIVMDRLGRSRMAGDPPDVLVAPRVGHISLIDFDRADEAISIGEEAFAEALPRIQEAMGILS